MIVEQAVEGGLVRAAVVDPATPARDAWFTALGFAAWLDATEIARFSSLASAWRKRLVVVETPGTGGPTRLTRAESLGLLRGDFGPLADRLMSAARGFAGELPLTGSLGYSMGASVATAVARRAATSGPPLDSVVLVEPVAVSRWRALELVKANRDQERLNLAAGMPGADGQPPWVRRSDQLLLANALRRGRISEDLDGTPPVRLVMARGTDSPLCDRAGMVRVMRRAQGAGHRVDLVEIPGSHAIWHLRESVATIAAEVSHALAR